jgi:Chaperone of endosialidase
MKHNLLFAFISLSLSTIYAQNMGINLGAGTIPTTTFDVNGSVAFREGTALSLINGVNSDIALGNFTLFRITGPTTTFSITGFTGGQDGRVLTLINTTSFTLSFTHQATSTSSNQINTGGSTISLAANGVANLVYNSTLTKWVLISTNGSAPTFSGIATGNTSDDILVVNGGVPGRVPPADYIETYAWGIDGNNNTTDGTHFLGTTNNVPLNFRINNQKAGRIDISNEATFLGYQAGNVNTGTDNTFIGYQAGRLNTSGESNTAVGAGALAAVTSGKDNVAIGFNALNVNTGDDNTAVGKLALSLNTSGTHNVAVGEGALERNTTGVQNTALGRQSLQFNTLGRDNTALGYSALLANTTADRNVAVGKNALVAQSFNNGGTAYNTQNVAVGYEALSVNQPTSSSNGINNTAVGYQAGKANTIGTNNTFIGNYAGEVNTTGSNNATLGYQAGNNITTGSNNIAIGYQAQVPTATANNQLSIGNWIYGVSGNIGIGTTSPTNSLDVEGRMAIGSSYAGTRTAPTNGLIVEGNVGINNYDGGSQYSSPTYSLSINRNHTDAGSNTPIGLLAYNNGTSPSTMGAASLHFQTARGTYAAPTAMVADGLLGVIGMGGYDGSGFSFPNHTSIEARAAQNWTTTAKGTYWSFYTTPNGTTTNAERMRINHNGNIGIACTAPQYRLHVVGDIAAQGGTLRAASATVSTTLTACSDVRFKQNITPLSNALDNVMKMQGVTYDWRVKEFPNRYFNHKKQIGIIAQEVEKIYPELVETDEEGYRSVDSSKLTPILVEAVKDLKKENDGLKKENEDLKSEIKSLKTELAKQGKTAESLLQRMERIEAALNR